MKYITGFFAFWYDFIVGDAWEVAAGVIIGLVAIYFATHAAGEFVATYSALALPVLIVALLSYSLWRVRGSAE